MSVVSQVQRPRRPSNFGLASRKLLLGFQRMSGKADPSGNCWFSWDLSAPGHGTEKRVSCECAELISLFICVVVVVGTMPLDSAFFFAYTVRYLEYPCCGALKIHFVWFAQGMSSYVSKHHTTQPWFDVWSATHNNNHNQHIDAPNHKGNDDHSCFEKKKNEKSSVGTESGKISVQLQWLSYADLTPVCFIYRKIRWKRTCTSKISRVS